MVNFSGDDNSNNSQTNLARERSTKILIVDYPPLLVQGMRVTLEKGGNLQVVGEADSFEGFTGILTQLTPDVVLIDADLPNIDLGEFTRYLFEKLPLAKIILLSSYCDDTRLFKAVQLGAVAYLSRELSPELLLQAIKKVASGQHLLAEAVIDKPKLVSQLVNKFRDFAIFPYPTGASPSLTEREKEVLQRVAKGDANKEIARDLGISDQTVKNHITSIFKKLNVDRRTRAALVAIEQGWVKESNTSASLKYTSHNGGQPIWT